MFCACVQLSVHIPFSSQGLHSIQPDTFQAVRMCHEPKCLFLICFPSCSTGSGWVEKGSWWGYQSPPCSGVRAPGRG